MIDLEALKRSAQVDTPEDAVVTRGWLQQVHAEISAGRAAQAQLRRARCMDDVVQDLRSASIERTSTL